MRSYWGGLAFAVGLMFASASQAEWSPLDPELFLDPDESETLALIASDLAKAGTMPVVASWSDPLAGSGESRVTAVIPAERSAGDEASDPSLVVAFLGETSSFEAEHAPYAQTSNLALITADTAEVTGSIAAPRSPKERAAPACSDEDDLQVMCAVLSTTGLAQPRYSEQVGAADWP